MEMLQTQEGEKEEKEEGKERQEIEEVRTQLNHVCRELAHQAGIFVLQWW